MRRRVLLHGLVSVVAARVLGACRTPSKDSGETGESAESSESDVLSSCAVEAGDAEAGWVEVRLADYPDLMEVGGSAAVSVDASLLHVVIAHVEPECWIAVWRVCTHGACEVAWSAEAREVVCPCHGSRFGEDGAVRTGPATEALRTFPVGRRDDSLWVHRPL